MEIRSGRVFLRKWREEDLEPLAKLNADRKVMEFFPATLDCEQSRAMMSRFALQIDQQGWGIWALDVPGVTGFAGFVGLNVPVDDLPFSPCVEIVWRLDADYWGKGFATEAARAIVEFGFASLGLAEIVAFTTTNNFRSQRVMQKLGMIRDSKGFDHPALPQGHPLRPHVLYRIDKQRWEHKPYPTSPSSEEARFPPAAGK